MGREGGQEGVDVLRFVGEQEGAGRPDAQGYFADDAEEAEVRADGGEVLGVLLFGDFEQRAVAFDEFDADDEGGDLGAVGEGGVICVGSGYGAEVKIAPFEDDGTGGMDVSELSTSYVSSCEYVTYG